jgi:SAM-dependent methyltransferase
MLTTTTYESATDAANSCLLNREVVDVIQDQSFSRREVVNCPLCARWHPATLVPARFDMKAVIAACKECRIAYQALRPSPAATLAYMNWRWASTDTYVADTGAQTARALRQLRIVETHVTLPLSILDFGAGSGAFVRVALDAGYKATGIERSETARAKARHRFDVELQTECPDDDAYRVVTLWDVIEHLRDPEESLKMLRSRMQAGGMIFIETGNWESWTRLKEKNKWRLILFDHQFYFTPRSLERVLANVGFTDFRVLDENRSHPRLSPHDWVYWLAAKARWTYSDITVMTACAKA